MKKISLIVAFLGVLQISPIFAYDGWSSYSDISIYRVRENGVVLIKQKINQNNPGNCTDTSWLQLRNKDKEMSKYIFSSILSSIATKKKVKFELRSCSQGGNKGNPLIIGIYID